ncbi:reverse transcriptase [compost metagenome]
MSKAIYEAIQNEALKLVRRHQKYAFSLQENINRVARRTGIIQAKDIKLPPYWACDDGFNPYHVRSHAKSVSHAVSRAIREKYYIPRPAAIYTLPKPDGGERRVSVFQVADNAVSRLVFKSLLHKNSNRMSPRCYSYRTDITLHDAVLHISSEFGLSNRLFVAEFDFSKYFDNVSHDHIERMLKDYRFYVTEREMHVVRGFLRAPRLDIDEYDVASTAFESRGIPQGTSISLFLANIAAFPLDRKLEQMGVGFVRYADDTLIWSPSYSAICEAVNALEEAATEMGVAINLRKSDGISILTESNSASEFKNKSSVSFIGYSINGNRISISDRSIAKAKKHISYLVYSNLIQPLKQGSFVASRISPGVDRDYVVAIFQIRRYLYGDLSETQLRKHIAGIVPKIHYRGLMSFYPIVDDDDLLRELDGWLLGTLARALRLREKLLRRRGVGSLPKPHGLTRYQLIYFTTNSSKGDFIDLRVPSFFRMASLLRKATRMYGPNAIAHPESGEYYF